MMKRQLFRMSWLFAVLLLLGACGDKDEVDKTAETLKQLAGNWIYTSEEDMQCYLITFYESGEFLYQSQEVDAKKTMAGKLTYNEDVNTITLIPTTGESPVMFTLGAFDPDGQQLQLKTSGGKTLAFAKTAITQLPAHDDWKPWEPLNVNDKTYLEETAKEFMNYFQANDFKKLTDIARGIKDYNTDELYTWQQECIESMTTLVSGKVEKDTTLIYDRRDYYSYNYDYNIRDFFYYYTDYKRLLRASAFKGHFTVQGNRWVYTQAHDLQFSFNDRQGNQCMLKLSTSGATKTVFVGENSDYNRLSSSWYDEYGNLHEEYLIDFFTTNSYLEIPEHISLTFTQGTQTLISTTADFDLSGISNEKWDMSRNSLSSVIKATVNGYDINAERISYSPTQESFVKLQLAKNGSLILSVDIEGTGYANITAENGGRDFDTSTLGSAKATIDIMGKIQIFSNISDIHGIRRAIENANDNRRSERDFKRYMEKANSMYTSFFCYANEGENYKRGSLTLEAFADNGYGGETWEARPIITFTKDNTSYAIDSYFTEDRFRTVTNTFWNLLDDFEDLGKSIGNGASWGSNDYWWASGLVVFNKDGGEKPIVVRCNGQWTLTDIPSWVKVSSTNGIGNDTIRVTAGVYTGSEARVATMNVKSGMQKRSVLVMQVPAYGEKQFDDPAAEIEGCYTYPSGDNHGFVSLKRISSNQVKLTYLYRKYEIEMKDSVVLSVTQTPEGIIYLKGQNVEGSFFVDYLYMKFEDDKNTTVFLRKKENTRGSGTLDDPFNAAAATALAEYIGSFSDDSQGEVYIKGKVASITENYGTQYGNATFKISDDGTDNNTFIIYRALYLGNRKYTNGNLLNVGDNVIVCGKVIYNNKTTPETIQGKAFLYSLNGKTEGGGNEAKETVIWQNDGSHGNINWSSDYRFASENNSNGEEIATIPADLWGKMKTGTFYILAQPNADWYNVRITTGWWDPNWNVGDIGADNEKIIHNDDGTFYIELNFTGDADFVGALDARHLLFTGQGYTPLKLYFLE